MKPLDVLREIGTSARTLLEQSMNIATVRDLALWPPFHAARDILSEAYGIAEEAIDSEAPQDLLPDSGRYPTERVQYEVLVFDKFLKRERRRSPRPRTDLVGIGGEVVDTRDEDLDLIIDTGQVDVSSLLSTNTGFSTPALGAILTFTQSWYMRGLALGNLIHSVALAPGESTKIAMIDWSRRTRASTTESIQEEESLSADISRTRAINEITSAVARETQTGQSVASSFNKATQEGRSYGSASLNPIIPGVETSGTSFGTSTSSGLATSWASSYGQRDVSAEMSQNITDRTHQAAHSARTRRASIVRETSQSESERLTTRTVTNYNHMHALTVQYYEVVQLYRTIIELSRATRCLFIPMKLVNFQNPSLVSRYRRVIASAGLNPRVRALAFAEPNSLAVSAPNRAEPWSNYTLNQGQAVVRQRIGTPNSQYLFYPLEGIIFKLSALSLSVGEKFESAIFESTNGTIRELTFQERSPTDVGPLGQARVFGKDVFPSTPSSDPEEIARANSDAAEGFLRISRIVLKKKQGQETFSGRVNVLLALDLLEGTPTSDFDDVFVRVNATIDVPADTTTVVAFELVHSVATRELIDHLQENQLHYSQAIWRSLDPASLGMLLAKYTYPIENNQVPLLELVDPVPIASLGNYLCFRAPGIDKPDVLMRRFAHRNREDLIPVPSGGVFAEAVLGRFNSAEKLNITRFWNWQDSPIPIQAPDIAPLQAGSRKTDEDLKPGQLGQPVLNIVNAPALPDPQGISGILAAIQNGNMFRDMSGLAATIGLAQAGLAGVQSGASNAATQAGQNAAIAAQLGAKVAELAAKIVAAYFTGGASLAAGGGIEGLAGLAGGVSGQGAKINHGAKLDEKFKSLKDGVIDPNTLGNGETSSYSTSTADEGNSYEVAAFDRSIGNPLIRAGYNPSGTVASSSIASTSSAQNIIDSFTSYGVLDEKGLAKNLLSRLPVDTTTVNDVLDALGSTDRDDVAFEIASQATNDQLTSIASTSAGKALLMRLIRELQVGFTDDDEAEQIERIVRFSSPSHAHLRAEAWSSSPAIASALLSTGATLQSISAGSGDFIFDEYVIVIERMPSGLSPEHYLEEMAADLNKAVNNPTFDDINVFTRVTGVGSRPPAIGDIYDIDIKGPDNGSVMLVEQTLSHFIFQTVTTSSTSTGTHPEFGSREFGFEKLDKGMILFYTRGASRPGATLIGVFGRGPQTKGWTSMMKGIGNKMDSRGGRQFPESFRFWTTHRH
jgi:hypothetical protein